jgi:hypothetical protein
LIIGREKNPMNLGKKYAKISRVKLRSWGE